MVIFSRLHDSDVSVAPTTGAGRSNGRGIVRTSQEYTRDVHHFGGNTALLSVRTAYGFGRETAPDELTTCFVLAYARDHLCF